MPPKSAELVRASQQGDLATVQKLVEAGIDVNGTDEHGMGPLLTFTPSVVEYLLSQGADPNRQRNESGVARARRHRLLAQGRVRAIVARRRCGTERATQRTGETPLHSALARWGEGVSEADRHDVVKLLIERARGSEPTYDPRRTHAGILAGCTHAR